MPERLKEILSSSARFLIKASSKIVNIPIRLVDATLSEITGYLLPESILERPVFQRAFEAMDREGSPYSGVFIPIIVERIRSIPTPPLIRNAIGRFNEWLFQTQRRPVGEFRYQHLDEITVVASPEEKGVIDLQFADRLSTRQNPSEPGPAQNPQATSVMRNRSTTPDRQP